MTTEGTQEAAQTPNLEDNGEEPIKPLPQQEKAQDGASVDDGKLVKLENQQTRNDLTNLTTNLTNLTNLNNLTNLTTEDKILIKFININTIKNISDSLHISLSVVSLAVHRVDRNTGLIPKGFIELIEQEGKIKKYKITEEGIKYLTSIYEEHQRVKTERRMAEEERLNAQDQIQKSKEFIEKNYLTILTDNLRKDKKVLVIDFNEFSKFNPSFAELLLEQPEETIKAMELGLEQLDLENGNNVKVRFINLPKSQELQISELRSKHLDKLWSVEGTVRQQSDVRPQVTAAEFECPSCGNILNVLQLDTNFKEPSRCGCGRKGKFILVSKELVDVQGLVLEENESQIEHLKSKRLNIFLKDDLTTTENEDKTLPGNALKVNGIIKEVPIILRTGSKSTRFDLMLEANSIETIEEEKEINISEKDIKEIKAFAKLHKEKVLDELTKKYCPFIYGNSNVKKALILSNVEGVRKQMGKVSVRGHFNFSVISPPGESKSVLFKYNSSILPKSRYICGSSSSGVGLTAAVVKDDFLKGWTLEAGALPMAKGGVANIDEADKFGEDELQKLAEPLEQETITISKATIQATIQCPVTTVFACNPREGRFTSDNLAEDLPDFFKLFFKDRQDLIFTINPTKEENAKAIDYMAETYLDDKQIVDDEFLRKYLIYARRLKPKLTKEFLDKVKEFYLKIKPYCDGAGVYTSKRLFNSLVRIGEAIAKIRISDTVDVVDGELSIELMELSLKEFRIEAKDIKEEQIK